MAITKNFKCEFYAIFSSTHLMDQVMMVAIVSTEGLRQREIDATN